MPKIRTNRGAAKRFSRTGSGKFKCSQSFKRHILTKKTPKRKRQLRKGSIVADADAPAVARMLPYS